MIINNVEIEDIDIMDVETLEKYQAARNEVVNKIPTIKNEEEKPWQGMKQLCIIVNEFFDSVFGKGTSSKVFKGRFNLKVSLKAFETVVDNVREQEDEMVSYKNEILNKYENEE